MQADQQGAAKRRRLRGAEAAAAKAEAAKYAVSRMVAGAADPLAGLAAVERQGPPPPPAYPGEPAKGPQPMLPTTRVSKGNLATWQS